MQPMAMSSSATLTYRDVVTRRVVEVASVLRSVAASLTLRLRPITCVGVSVPLSTRGRRLRIVPGHLG